MCVFHAGKLRLVDWLEVDALVNVLVLAAFKSGQFIELGAFSKDCDESGTNCAV